MNRPRYHPLARPPHIDLKVCPCCCFCCHSLQLKPHQLIRHWAHSHCLCYQVQIKNKLKANAKPLTELGFSAAVYCTLFHEAKRGLKTGVRHIAKSRRCACYPVSSHLLHCPSVVQQSRRQAGWAGRLSAVYRRALPSCK